MQKNILIAEDDKVLVEMLKFMLGENGYKIQTASNGWKALQIIEAGGVDLIITDINMPELSGLDLMNILKRYYLHKIPIIIISSMDKSSLIAPAFRLGANSVIDKPIDFPFLLNRIKEVLRKNKVVMD